MTLSKPTKNNKSRPKAGNHSKKSKQPKQSKTVPTPKTTKNSLPLSPPDCTLLPNGRFCQHANKNSLYNHNPKTPKNNLSPSKIQLPPGFFLDRPEKGSIYHNTIHSRMITPKPYRRLTQLQPADVIIKRSLEGTP